VVLLRMATLQFRCFLTFFFSPFQYGQLFGLFDCPGCRLNEIFYRNFLLSFPYFDVDFSLIFLFPPLVISILGRQFPVPTSTLLCPAQVQPWLSGSPFSPFQLGRVLQHPGTLPSLWLFSSIKDNGACPVPIRLIVYLLAVTTCFLRFPYSLPRALTASLVFLLRSPVSKATPSVSIVAFL